MYKDLPNILQNVPHIDGCVETCQCILKAPKITLQSLKPLRSLNLFHYFEWVCSEMAKLPK